MNTGNIKSNKGGRPKKNETDKVFKGYKVYFSSRENKIFTDFVKKNNLQKNSNTSILKNIILNSIKENNIIFKKIESPEYLNSLNQLGINLNQITKKLNSLNNLSGIDQDKMNVLFVKITQLLESDDS